MVAIVQLIWFLVIFKKYPLNFYPKNQKIYVQSAQTKHLADLFAQSKPKKVAKEVFNWASRLQNCSQEQTGHTNLLPFTSTTSGVFCLNNPMEFEYLVK